MVPSYSRKWPGDDQDDDGAMKERSLIAPMFAATGAGDRVIKIETKEQIPKITSGRGPASCENKRYLRVINILGQSHYRRFCIRCLVIFAPINDE